MSKQAKKNEIEEIDEIFENFQKFAINYENREIDYEEIYKKNELINHFNRRILECNNLCIRHPEINTLLYEEEKCLNNCQRKILEVNSIVGKYMKELNIDSLESPYINQH
jgi:hypothetical protein